MYIVQIASECAPVIKAGGLGDVVYGLSRDIENRGHTLEIILPMYDCMRYDKIWNLHIAYEDLNVPWYGGTIHTSVYCGWVDGLQCFFVQPHSHDNFFNRGCYYGNNDDHMRFTFFSKAALEFLLVTGKRPDVIHCHDWQTGLVPVMLFEQYSWLGMGNQRVCYTIHNFKHQGFAGKDVLYATRLNNESHFFSFDRLRDNFNPFGLNLMKGGIVYSNHVNTVSPHHAWEARFTDVSYGLGHTLDVHQNKFNGILNGIDYKVWNPEDDPYIPYHYNSNNLKGKWKNRKALRDRLLLRDENKPIVAFIGRLDEQKGVGLVHYSIYYSLRSNAQFVLLGSPTGSAINNQFWGTKHQLNDNPDCHLELGFNEELAHLIYAGADIIIVPSQFEPCGLTQMIGLRYGTVPVVRGVGGLVDTVFDKDYDQFHKPEERNGYVFYQNDPPALESALERAIGLWHYYPDEFKKLQKQGMKYDYSWKNSGQQYIDVYERIRHKEEVVDKEELSDE